MIGGCPSHNHHLKQITETLMSNTTSTFNGLQLQSKVQANSEGSGELVLSLANVTTPAPKDDEVVVRVQATPINPSDIGLLFGPADMGTAVYSGTPTHPVVTARIPAAAMKGMAGRLNEAMPVGNEGAGVVVAAGASAEAQALLGKTVALLGGAMYAQFRCVKAAQCLPLAEGTTAAEGASCFVNPLTALGMVETMKLEGHTALVHTAAASNLGQMLNKICRADGIKLVNIVRNAEAAAVLRYLGAEYICDSSLPSFLSDLTEALVATGATLAFDATGGGVLAGQILTCMEAAINRSAKEYSRYGSNTMKQVYIYGGLDMRPTEIVRNFGMTWGVGGWLLFPFLNRAGAATAAAMKARVARELKTTFASHYAKEISLTQALSAEAIGVYGQRTTGEKYLINPSLG
jgi:NADPH:quinone reductase